MGAITLYRLKDGKTVVLPSRTVSLEKSLQNIFENNLETLLGIHFLKSEHSTGARQRGRIDTLGIDENYNPVIIEYKRSTNQNVINQGLYYLDWLLDHRAEFKAMVADKLGEDGANKIDWSTPRLVCIASGFTIYDEHAVKQMNKNIDLVRYRKFGDEFLLLELINIASQKETVVRSGGSTIKYRTVTEKLDALEGVLRDIYEELYAFLSAMGSDVQVKTLKYYIAFKRTQNFACVQVHSTKGCLTIHTKLNPKTIDLVEGFTRDVSNIGHYGTGNLEITIQSREDLEKAKLFLQQSYEAN